MDLRTYLNSLPIERQKQFALRCGTTIGYLRKALSVRPRFDPALSAAIERESNGVVRRWDLHPTEWPDIWPELIGVEGAPSARLRRRKPLVEHRAVRTNLD